MKRFRIFFALTSYFLYAGINSCFAYPLNILGNTVDIPNYITDPNWIIACDNLNECSAVGYPLEGGDSVGQPWYINANWNKDSDDVTFYMIFSYYGQTQDEIKKPDFSIQLCLNAKECRTVVKGNEMNFSGSVSGSDIEGKLQFTLNMKKQPKISYIICSDDKENPIPLDDLLEDRNSIKIDYLTQLAGKEKTYKITGVDDTPDGNYVVKYENGDKFLFSDNGIEVVVTKYDGKIYKETPVIDKATLALTEWEDHSFDPISFNDDHRTFEVDNTDIGIGSQWGCSVIYDVAYNGEKFILDRIRVMPLCMNIMQKDWPVVYQRPS